MSEKKDVYSEVKGQMRLTERIVAFLPGFRGYKEKELRRESDKLIRNHLSDKLSSSKDELRTVSQMIADRRYFDVMTDLDRLNARMDRVTEKINHASYGYTGMFDAVKIKEEQLDKMIDFDYTLLDDITAVAAEVGALKTDIIDGITSNMKIRIQNIIKRLDNLENTFDKRKEVILGVI
jgi:hypothetical protein